MVILVVLVISVQGCNSTSGKAVTAALPQKYYLKNNIHAQAGAHDTKASYANWTDPGAGHFVIPVNTPVEFERFRKGLVIKDLSDGRIIYFEYNSKSMGMSAEEYIHIIASPNKLSLEGLSSIDQKGINEGKVRTGMTKNGVRIALGYPAAHKTPSLESNTWIYWRNRFRTMAVEFGDDGKVKTIR